MVMLSRDVPAVIAALALAIGSTGAVPVAGGGDITAPKCNRNNCYNNLFDSRYSASAQSFCPGFLAATTTAAAAVPTAFKNCKDVSALSSACSCVVYTAPATTTTTASSSTSTSTASSSSSTSLLSSSSSSTSSSSVPGVTPPSTCNHNNCYLNLIDSRFIGTAQSFCPEFLAATTTEAAAIPTAFKNCKNDVGKVSSACSCILGTTASPSPTSSPTSSATEDPVTSTVASSTSTDASATSTTSSGPAACTTTAGQAFVNPGFEDSRFDATPWLTSEGVVFIRDETKAHTEEAYLSVPITDRSVSPSISQTVDSLDPTHEYTITYFWALGDKQEIYDGDCLITTTVDGQLAGITSTRRQTAYNYFQARVLFTPAAASVDVAFTFNCGGNYFYGTEFLIDDITLTQSCPSCAPAPAPAASGASCDVVGWSRVYSAGLGNGDQSSRPNCAQSCADTAGCLSFLYFDGPSHNANSACQLFSASVADLQITPAEFGRSYSDLACFQCSA